MMNSTDSTKIFFAGILQFDVRSGDIAANLARVEAGLADIASSRTDNFPGIVVLPELWATGFAYDRLPELAGEIPGLLAILRNLAAKHRVHIAGSLPEFSAGSHYNTLYITGSSGTVGQYRKQRLFHPMGEDGFFSPAATAALPILTEMGPVGALVCYDLRFPEILRAQTGLGADIAVISAQWPAPRIGHWRTLLQARAIENQMFVIGANRCGATGDTAFGGHSMVVAPDGAILLEADEYESFQGAALDLAMIAEARSLFRSLPERPGPP